jgi:branched-chain amino acid transport system permease protein
MSGVFTVRNIAATALIAALVLLPVYSTVFGDRFILTLFTRIVIMALAAVSLNLILGFGGMMSFGHAAYLGIGGYAVGILAHEGIGSGFIQWPVALVASALFALVIGALSLRTRGVYFIMITLAFAQMAYYLVSGLARYGGDDGLTIYKRSQFIEPLNLSNKVQFYYVCLVILLATMYFIWRLSNSRFGMVVQGARSNETRMRAIGFPTYRYRLVCFVIAGTLGGLSGVLLANHGDFVSPAMMYWTRSGDLIIMVVLGGMATTFGPLIGAIAFLLLEEFLPLIIKVGGTPFFGASAASRGSEYWMIVMGPLLLLVVLFARGGIDGMLKRLAARFAPKVRPEAGPKVGP